VHATTILHRCLDTLLKSVHSRRRATLFDAVAACVAGPRLTLTEIGRRFAGGTNLRHNIKRADRLLGNVNLQHETSTFYGALCRVLLAKVREPLILVDWSDLKEDQSVHLLRASLAVGGRSLTLYEEVHPRRKLGNRDVQCRFLSQLASLMPAKVAPIIVADSGFKVPFYRHVERLGWRWVGRVRGRDYLRLDHRWKAAKPSSSGPLQFPRPWVSENGFAAIRFLPCWCWCVSRRQGRHGQTAFGKRSRSKSSQQSARAAKEPWLLVASPSLAHLPAKRLVKIYRQRMQIEESFRDMKSQHFGEGLECSRSQGVGRFRVLVLIASLAAFLLWLLGTAAELSGLHKKLYPTNRKRRVYSKLFLGRLLLTLKRCRDDLDRLVQSISNVEQWISASHDSLLLE
jgi:hypothetical protein